MAQRFTERDGEVVGADERKNRLERLFDEHVRSGTRLLRLSGNGQHLRRWAVRARALVAQQTGLTRWPSRSIQQSSDRSGALSISCT